MSVEMCPVCGCSFHASVGCLTCISSAEKSSSGTDPKGAAAADRVKLALIPPAAEIQIARALMDGAAKYGEFNWRGNTVEAMTYVHATRRHMAAWIDGEEVAPDSGVHHLAHAIASLVVLLDAFHCGTVQDNRPKPAAKQTRKLLDGGNKS